jgi:hypothetical protein
MRRNETNKRKEKARQMMFPVISLKGWEPNFQRHPGTDNPVDGGGSVEGPVPVEALSFWVNIEIPVSAINRPNVSIMRLASGRWASHFAQTLTQSTKTGGRTVQMPPGSYTIEIN